jgi:hypothetical protein
MCKRSVSSLRSIGGGPRFLGGVVDVEGGIVVDKLDQVCHTRVLGWRVEAPIQCNAGHVHTVAFQCVLDFGYTALGAAYRGPFVVHAHQDVYILVSGCPRSGASMFAMSKFDADHDTEKEVDRRRWI